MKGLMISKDYLDVRAGRTALAMNEHGITHDALCFRRPPQFNHAYGRITVDPYMGWQTLARRVRESDADVIHVHGELFGFWQLLAAKDGAEGRPVVLNIHDLSVTRPDAMLDPYESAAIQEADGIVWVTDACRDFALKAGYEFDAPDCVVSNMVSSSCFLKTTPLPHLGGVCFAGGTALRDSGNDRDMSAIADALPLHIYSGGTPCDYGIQHPVEPDYQLYINRIAQHDWCFSGSAQPIASWGVAMATKVTEGFAAGVPGIWLNSPECIPFAEMGMGVYCKTVRDVVIASKLDPRPYRKAVMAQRAQFTAERTIEPLVELYRSLA